MKNIKERQALGMDCIPGGGLEIWWGGVREVAMVFIQQSMEERKLEGGVERRENSTDY